jgi:hypothetical protein
MTFFKNFFLAVGILWTLSAIAILVFQLSYQPKEIILTLVLPLAWALVKLFDNTKPSSLGQE